MYQSTEVADQMQIFLTSPVEALRNQAHSYLLAFQAAPEAWGICRELMVPSTPKNPLILSSQMFYKKLQNELPDLNLIQRAELKSYLLGLVLTDFNCSQMLKKLCQSLALIGVAGINSFWEDFIIDVLRLPKLEVLLEIIDCVPFCLEEYVLPKRTVELVKTRLRENIQSIMECLYLTIKEKNYIAQVLEIIKNWRIVSLPIFTHAGLFEELALRLSRLDENFPQICEAFVNAVTCSPYAQLLQQSNYKGSVAAYSSSIPPNELQAYLILLNLLSSLPYLTSSDQATQRWGTELLVSFSTNFLFFLLEPISLWERLKEATGHPDLSVCIIVVEFYYSLKEALNNMKTLPDHMFPCLLICSQSLAFRCKYLSHEFFFDKIRKKAEDEELDFMQFRISAEDVFYSVFLIFNKHHSEKGRGLVKELGGFITPPDEFNTEVFVFMMRSMLLGITEHNEWPLLQDTPQPLVVKSTIFLISDISGGFDHLPELFPSALEYILTHGLLSASSQQFYIDSNTIECLRNLSIDCLDLFTPEMVHKTLEISQTVLTSLPANYGDKLIEAVMNLLIRLPPNEIAAAQHKILTFILLELKAASPNQLAHNSVNFLKGIAFMSAAFGALGAGNSQENWRNFKEIVVETVDITLKDLGLYKDKENVMMAIYLLMKRVMKAVSVFADCFFPKVCEALIAIYVPGKEDGMSVIITGISLLFNEPNTKQWLTSNYLSLFALISSSLSQTLFPDTICTFYDLQSKLFESGLAILSDTLSKTLEITVFLSSSLQERNSSRSLLTFCGFLFSKRIEDLAQVAIMLSKSLLCSLSSINSNTFQHLSTVLNTFKRNYMLEFTQGVSLALCTETFTKFSQNEKERLLYCFINCDCETVQRMKQLTISVSNVLRNQGTFDAIVATEIAIGSAYIRRTTIEIEN